VYNELRHDISDGRSSNLNHHTSCMTLDGSMEQSNNPGHWKQDFFTLLHSLNITLIDGDYRENILFEHDVDQLVRSRPIQGSCSIQIHYYGQNSVPIKYKTPTTPFQYTQGKILLPKSTILLLILTKTDSPDKLVPSHKDHTFLAYYPKT
jgi:hypothetical protein